MWAYVMLTRDAFKLGEMHNQQQLLKIILGRNIKKYRNLMGIQFMFGYSFSVLIHFCLWRAVIHDIWPSKEDSALARGADSGEDAVNCRELALLCTNVAPKLGHYQAPTAGSL